MSVASQRRTRWDASPGAADSREGARLEARTTHGAVHPSVGMDGGHGCATDMREGPELMAMQWDSGEAALEEIDEALKGIAGVNAALASLAEAKKQIDEQMRVLRDIRSQLSRRRDLAMKTALDGRVAPETVAERAGMRPTAMYQAISRAIGRGRR